MARLRWLCWKDKLLNGLRALPVSLLRSSARALEDALAVRVAMKWILFFFNNRSNGPSRGASCMPFRAPHTG